ncbi:MAG: amino acid adenylation domain-containing protein, partial [Acidobacteriota bacterium]
MIANRKNIEDVYALSPLQQGIFFHTLYSPNSGVYVEQLSCVLRGKLNVSAFKQAWQQVLERHPILRTAFVWKDLDQPVQVVRRNVSLPWTEEDWRGLDNTDQQERLNNYLKEDLYQGFNLSKAPLMRVALITLAENCYQFIWTHHHLVMDGWCLSLILNDAFAFYEAGCQGRSPQLARNRPYRDYLAWLQQQDLVKAEEFWRTTLQGFLAPTPLTIDRNTVNLLDNGYIEEYGEKQLELEANLTSALQALARQHKLTLNTFIQGAWAILLSRYSGEKDIVFGTVVSGREAELSGIESMVGLFINTLPMRVHIYDEEPLLSWLHRLQEHQVELRQYEYSPLLKIKQWSEVPGERPLFESIVVFENYPVDAALSKYVESLAVSNIHFIDRTNFPLTLAVVPGQQLLLRLGYDSRRFDNNFITRLLGHLETILENIVNNPTICLNRISLLTEKEQHQLLVEWNQTAQDYPYNQCLHRLFEEQVKRSPDAVALVFEDEWLTYRELNERANQLAYRLQALGITSDNLVGICLERSNEMVVGLFAILKTGAAYLPLDPTYPKERLAFMLADAKIPVVLTQQRLKSLLTELTESLSDKIDIICLDTEWSAIIQESVENPNSTVTPYNLAYTIYTSGSTGKPKGAMNTHQAICNRLLWMQDTYQLKSDDAVLQKTPFSFDVSVWEFFWPLLVGARLVIAQPGGHQDSAYLVKLIIQEQITTLHFVPPMLQAFLEESGIKNCHSLRRLICSGEALAYELQERFYNSLNAELHNLYGPTEAAVDVTYWACQSASNRRIVPIGRPIANTEIYILDTQMQAVPIGVAGELHIGGIGLARGYLNRPEL